VVLKYENNYYYIYKAEGGKLYGNKILRYLSHMNSFSEVDSETKVFDEESIENAKHYDQALKREVYSYRVIGKVVPMKDSDIKLIIP